MSVDFATFDLTELAVLDATDTVGVPAIQASLTAFFADDVDDLMGKPSKDVMGSACCSCATEITCCCCS
ncbi:hypothetical protein ACFVUN_29660 [Kitasatospora griseola]|uniref:hypothetical protein n=1 Tax=Kitasatospora griseola TaxID=2064 RepID=UPI0036D82BD7